MLVIVALQIYLHGTQEKVLDFDFGDDMGVIAAGGPPCPAGTNKKWESLIIHLGNTIVKYASGVD